MAVELVAVRLERARVAFAGGDLCFEALKPPTGQRVEAQPRRDRHDAAPNGGDERRAVASRLPDVGPDGAKPKPAGMPAADRGLAERGGQLRGQGMACLRQQPAQVGLGRYRIPADRRGDQRGASPSRVAAIRSRRDGFAADLSALPKVEGLTSRLAPGARPLAVASAVLCAPLRSGGRDPRGAPARSAKACGDRCAAGRPHAIGTSPITAIMAQIAPPLTISGAGLPVGSK